MKSIKGILLIVGSILLTLITWYQAGLTRFIGPGIALTNLSLTFLLATRSSILEKWFNGIENMYLAHKITAVLSLILLFFHNYSMGSIWGSQLAGQFGNLAIYLFFSIIIVALLGKFLKYESWRFIHRFIFLAYILGLLHAYLILGGQLISFSLLGLVTNLFTIIGLVSGIYIIFLYQTIAFKHWGRLVKVDRLTPSILEIEIELLEALDYQYGQFAFIKIFQEGIEKAPHPFSISGGDGKRIHFTIKVAGDFTQSLYDKLEVGSKVALDRAYGHLLLKEGGPKQVWIAGGIGLTPFLSYLREGQPLPGQVDLFYTVSKLEDAVHVDLMQAYASKDPNFNFHLVEGRLSGDQLPLSKDSHVFLCGPQVMMDSLAQEIKKKESQAKITYERFSFK